MSRDSRTILRFAVAGTVIAAAVSAGFFAYLKTGPPNNWITIAVVLGIALVLAMCRRRKHPEVQVMYAACAAGLSAATLQILAT